MCHTVKRIPSSLPDMQSSFSASSCPPRPISAHILIIHIVNQLIVSFLIFAHFRSTFGTRSSDSIILSSQPSSNEFRRVNMDGEDFVYEYSITAVNIKDHVDIRGQVQDVQAARGRDRLPFTLRRIIEPDSPSNTFATASIQSP